MSKLAYRVVDYSDITTYGLAALLLDGWQAADGTHISNSDVDDLSYLVLTKSETE